MFCAGLFSSSDTFAGCSGVVVTVLNVYLSDLHEFPRVLLRCQNMFYEFFGAEHMKQCLKCDPDFFTKFCRR